MPEQPAKVGQELTFTSGSQMMNFTSKSLKRTFETIYFCGPPAGQTGGDDSLKGKKSPGSQGSVAKTAEKVKVAKAKGANAYTVAELYRLKSTLNGKQVVIRGKVVKVSAGIMGRTWIHLQDGTGSAKHGTHDLVVTSQAVPAVGEVVTVTGKLVKDRDFGSGYRYAVIVEEGKIGK